MQQARVALADSRLCVVHVQTDSCRESDPPDTPMWRDFLQVWAYDCLHSTFILPFLALRRSL